MNETQSKQVKDKMRKLAILQQESRSLDERIATAVQAVRREREDLKGLQISHSAMHIAPLPTRAASREDNEKLLKIELKTMRLQSDQVKSKAEAAELRTANIEKQLQNALEKLDAMPTAFSREEKAIIDSETELKRQCLEQEHTNYRAKIKDIDTLTKLERKLSELKATIKTQSMEKLAAESRSHEWTVRLGAAKKQIEPLQLHLDRLRQKAHHFIRLDPNTHIPMLATALLHRRSSLHEDDDHYTDLHELVFGPDSTVDSAFDKDTHDGLTKALFYAHNQSIQQKNEHQDASSLCIPAPRIQTKEEDYILSNGTMTEKKSLLAEAEPPAAAPFLPSSPLDFEY